LRKRERGKRRESRDRRKGRQKKLIFFFSTRRRRRNTVNKCHTCRVREMEQSTTTNAEAKRDFVLQERPTKKNHRNKNEFTSEIVSQKEPKETLEEKKHLGAKTWWELSMGAKRERERELSRGRERRTGGMKR